MVSNSQKRSLSLSHSLWYNGFPPSSHVPTSHICSELIVHIAHSLQYIFYTFIMKLRANPVIKFKANRIIAAPNKFASILLRIFSCCLFLAVCGCTAIPPYTQWEIDFRVCSRPTPMRSRCSRCFFFAPLLFDGQTVAAAKCCFLMVLIYLSINGCMFDARSMETGKFLSNHFCWYDNKRKCILFFFFFGVSVQRGSWKPKQKLTKPETNFRTKKKKIITQNNWIRIMWSTADVLAFCMFKID